MLSRCHAIKDASFTAALEAEKARLDAAIAAESASLKHREAEQARKVAAENLTAMLGVKAAIKVADMKLAEWAMGTSRPEEDSEDEGHDLRTLRLGETIAGATGDLINLQTYDGLSVDAPTIADAQRQIDEIRATYGEARNLS